MSLAAGARLGPYEVLGLIGAGGMGEVYKSRGERLARFRREAELLASLAHPHICTLYDIGEHIPSGPSPLAPCPYPLSTTL